jgi:GntR family transcriptional repressor for pyruvate dehydrogenase complex
LKSIQGKGCFVREDLAPGDASGFTVYDIQAATHIIDLVEVREILECNAVRLASQRADSEDITRIQKACSNMKRTMMDLDRFTEHDFEFHMAIARATGNRMILELMKRIVEKVHKEYERFKPTALFKRDEAFFTAEQITDAIKQGDAQRAANLMKAHLNLVTTEIKHKIQDAK